jgi:hypothetical protein
MLRMCIPSPPEIQLLVDRRELSQRDNDKRTWLLVIESKANSPKS